MNTAIEAQIAGFLGKYSPQIATQLREARARLRACFPRGFELVFDNYNALVFGFSPTDRRSDAFVSVVGYPKWVTLFFLHGVDLADPTHLLQGQGKQVRSIRLASPADIDSPDVTALIAQATDPYRNALLIAPALTTVVKLALATQRSRRPAASADAGRKPREK